MPVIEPSPQLGKYRAGQLDPGAGLVKRMLWYITNALIFDSWAFPISGLKIRILRLFGASVGVGVVIKPRVNIKHPWKLTIQDHVWLGEGVWIDNLVSVWIGSNVCISQGATLLTGNHDYKDPSFGLITGEVVLEDGVWIAAGAYICPGVLCGRNSVVTVGSVLRGNALPNGIYSGNPALLIRQREIRC